MSGATKKAPPPVVEKRLPDDAETRRVEAGEVMTAMKVAIVNLDGAPLKADLNTHMRAYIHDLIMLTRRYADGVNEGVARVEDWYTGDAIDRRELEKLVRAGLREAWGDDPGLDVFAAMIARGRYLT